MTYILVQYNAKLLWKRNKLFHTFHSTNYLINSILLQYNKNLSNVNMFFLNLWTFNTLRLLCISFPYSFFLFMVDVFTTVVLSAPFFNHFVIFFIFSCIYSHIISYEFSYLKCTSVTLINYHSKKTIVETLIFYRLNLSSNPFTYLYKIKYWFN